MRVVIVGTRGFPGVQGGVENHCENLAIHLVKLGCEVIVFTRMPYVDHAVTNYNGVRLISLPTIRHKSLEAFIHTFFAIIASSKYKPDIIHIHGIGPGFFAWLARMLGHKVVLTTHGSNYKHLKWNKVERAILKFFERQSLKWSHGIIAISAVIAEELKQNYNQDAVMIPNGVNILKPAQSKEKLWELDIISEKYILAVGRLVPEKGFHDLIKAFCDLNLEDWKLIIVGNADLQTSYSTFLLREGQHHQQILFTGFLTGIPLYELYSHAGLFILPSYYEGLPISLLEAMSFGLTCIVSDIEGNRNLKLPEENYFEAGDIEHLKATILKLMAKQRTHAEKLAQIDYIKENYSWEKIAASTYQVYKKVLK
jgi:Glycosyltransferase